MARDWHGHPLCHHERYEPCRRWWCTYRLLIGICSMFLLPVAVYAAADPEQAYANLTESGPSFTTTPPDTYP